MGLSMDGHWILHARSRRHHYQGAGTASIKSFAGGLAAYRVERGERTLDASRYMVLNDGQPYEITIDAPTPVESFCVFFRPGFAQEVHRDLAATLPKLLDDPWGPARPIEVDTVPRRHDDLVSPILRRLKHNPPEEPWALEEQLHRLMEAVLMVRPLGGSSPELTRRLWIAYDYLRSNFAGAPTLAETAAVAALSPNHLIRSYRAAFGRTPHQHLTEMRMARARELLARHGRSVTEACLEVGFASLGSFSDAFRRRYGVRPSQAGDLEVADLATIEGAPARPRAAVAGG
jgi:AraC family transcriptional regulator